MDSGKPFLTVINELAEEFCGKDFPISVEINPHLINAEDMIQAAKELSSISDNFVIKIPCNEQGLIAAKKLAEQKVRTKVTLVFTASQALQAGRIGAKYVSPFSVGKRLPVSTARSLCRKFWIPLTISDFRPK